MSISAEIIARLKEGKKRFFANDNIADYIKENELQALEDELTEKFEEVLRTLIIDIDHDPNSRNTPRRMAKMYLHELFKGRYYPMPKVTAFPNEAYKPPVLKDTFRPAYSYSGLLVIPADIKSVCSHHHQIVSGTAYIGILPGTKVIGLSKYVRVARWLARRGTLQEQLTEDILKTIQKITETQDVAVVFIATHGCMACRGVEAHNPYVASAELGGRFYEEPDLRSELYKHIEMIESRKRGA